MLTIARPMGTGKTKELLEYAAAHNGQILTTDKHALQVKANSYGIEVPIIDLYDYFENEDCDHDKPIYVHKIEDVFQELLGGQIAGYSVRLE